LVRAYPNGSSFRGVGFYPLEEAERSMLQDAHKGLSYTEKAVSLRGEFVSFTNIIL
jgi:hypothetical protein